MKLGRLRGPLVAPAVSPAGGDWSLEVQIHPSDIRRRVRYFFLARWQITLLGMAVLVYVAGLALGAALAPGVIAGLMSRQEYQVLTAERTRQGERLQELVEHADQLDRRAGELNLRMEKVFLAYGLPPVAPRRRPQPADAAGSPSIYSGTIEQGDRLRSRLATRLDALEGSLAAVRGFETQNPEQVRTTPSVCPLRGSEFVLVSSYGRRRSPFTRELERHTGIDLAAPVGTPVFAPADGVVAFAGQYPVSRNADWWRYGNLVMLEDGGDYVTIYGHADRLEVKPGQRVKRGDLLATVGITGWSTSPHLHYEVRRKGTDGVYRPVDPLIYILDHRWPNEEQLLAKARTAPPASDFEPLPSGVGSK